MTRLLVAVLGALAILLTTTTAANASSNPSRTEKQADAYIEKRVETGSWMCMGRNGNHTDLYRSFNCYIDDYEADTSVMYRLNTRPHGRWHLRILR